jgi:MYXO-CTERM domain-containing protein
MSVRSLALSRAPSVKSPQPVGQGAAQFQNTIYWAGINSVTVGGIPVTGYTISSLSGTNYNQSFEPASAVPEPSNCALAALAGLCALYHRRRR